MVNTTELKNFVRESGMTMQGIARKMGVSYRSLHRKVRNETPFRTCEIEAFCRIIGVTTKAEKERIFSA